MVACVVRHMQWNTHACMHSHTHTHPSFPFTCPQPHLPHAVRASKLPHAKKGITLSARRFWAFTSSQWGAGKVGNCHNIHRVISRAFIRPTYIHRPRTVGQKIGTPTARRAIALGKQSWWKSVPWYDQYSWLFWRGTKMKMQVGLKMCK